MWHTQKRDLPALDTQVFAGNQISRSRGEGIVEFKRGVQGIEDDGSAGRGDGQR